METTVTVNLFGPVHMDLLTACAAAGFIIIAATRLWATPAQAYRVACVMALYTVLQEFVDRAGHFYWNHESLVQILPLQMCGVSVFAVPLMLVTRSFLLYEIMYFWGLGGPAVALLMPQVPFSFPNLLCITFFTSHALIIIGVLFATVVYGFRPTWRSYVKTTAFSLAYLAAMIPVNLLLKTNFLYICEKPRGASLLDAMGQWPWYVPGMIALGMAIFALLYAPFQVLAWRRGPAAP